MKIVLIGPVYPYRGGIAHFTTLLGFALQANHDLKVVSFRRQYPRWLYPGRTDRDPSRQSISIQAEYLLDPLKPWTWVQTGTWIRDFSPHVVVIQWWTTFWALPLGVLCRMLVRKGLPVVYIAHNVLPHESHAWDKALALFALRAGSAFIVMTETQRTLLNHLMPGKRVAVVPHPDYTGLAKTDTTREQARMELGLPKQARIALFFGFVRPYKRLGDLIEAIGLLHHRGQEVFLLVAGEFWEPEGKYDRQVHRLGLEKSVRFYNRYIPNEEIAPLFHAADVCIVPHLPGIQSGVAALARSFGLPIVTTRGEDVPRGSTLGVFLAEAKDSDSLAGAIALALSTPPTRKQMAEAIEEEWDKLAHVIETLARHQNEDLDT